MGLSVRPRARTVVAAAIAALALAGAALSVVAVEDVAALMLRRFFSSRHLLSVAITTPIMLALALAIGVARPSRVGARTFFACAVLGWLNAPASLLLHDVAFGTPVGREVGALLVAGLVVGLLVATPFGMLYGLVSALATKRLRTLLDRPTLSAGNDAVFTVAVTVLGAASLATLVAALREEPMVPWAAPASLAAVAALAAALAALRGRWIRGLVRDPARAGFERVSLDALGIDASSLVPLHASVSAGAMHALVRPLPAGEGAYRHGSPRVPIALVD